MTGYFEASLLLLFAGYEAQNLAPIVVQLHIILWSEQTGTWFRAFKFKSIMKRFVYINDDNLSQDLYCDNRISNRKYTVLNFLPKNLLEQFR